MNCNRYRDRFAILARRPQHFVLLADQDRRLSVHFRRCAADKWQADRRRDAYLKDFQVRRAPKSLRLARDRKTPFAVSRANGVHEADQLGTTEIETRGNLRSSAQHSMLEFQLGTARSRLTSWYHNPNRPAAEILEHLTFSPRALVTVNRIRKP